MKDKPLNLKYVPTLFSAFLLILLIAAAMFLFAGRTKEALQIKFLTSHFSNFYQHISNFTISFIFVAGPSFLWLLMGIRFKNVLFLGLLILLLNVVTECWIRILNTPDLTDAYYGIAGVMMALIFLIWVNIFGLVKNPLNQKAD